MILHCTTLTFWRCIAEYYHLLFYCCSFLCDIRIVDLTRRCKPLIFAFLCYITSIGSLYLCIKRWQLQWLSRTPNPVIKVTAFFEVEYLINGASYRQIYYSTLIGNHTVCNGTMFGDLNWPQSASCSLSEIAEFLVSIDSVESHHTLLLVTWQNKIRATRRNH